MERADAVGGNCHWIGASSWSWTHSVQARPDDRRPEAGLGEHVRSPLIEASRELARVAAEVTPSVAHIESKVESPSRGLLEETGSGVIVTSPKIPGYYVVTNRHVVGDAADLSQISVRLSDGRAFHPTRRWIDRETDLAVLSIDAQTAKAITWGNSDRLEIGNIVLAVGSPFGLSQSVTMGIVSARDAPCVSRNATPSSIRISSRPTRRSILAIAAAR